MLYEFFVYVFPVASLVGSLAMLAMMRSSKDWPRTYDQWRSEFFFQYHGVRGVTDDKINRTGNRVDLFDQKGRIAIITGGNRGIGLHVVEKLLDCKITVILAVRNVESSRKAVFAAIPEAKREGLLSFETLDVGDMKSVREFASVIKSKHSKIDILINNAGIMAAPFKITADGFESQMAVNYLGHFLLTHLLLPLLKAAGTEQQNARIVNVSSCVHLNASIDFDDFHCQKDYYPITAYNASKLAQVMFTKSLHLLLQNEQARVQTHALHPGVVDTDLFEHTSSTQVAWFKKLVFKNAEEGSRTIVYAAISPKIENKGGSYLSNCRFVTSSKFAKDQALCKKLFEYTCSILKIREFGNLTNGTLDQ